MRSYQLLSGLLGPFVFLWLSWRRLNGKEDKARFRERFGFASKPRPAGTLLWLHAASVGEANSVLMLMDKIRARIPAMNILLTTGTVTSARLMQVRLPKNIIHQFVPVDTPQATARFMRHWKPDFAFWTESEFWPNLVMEADKRQCFMGIINGRLSERSMRTWKRFAAGAIRDLLSRFNIIFAQSDEDAARLEALGARGVMSLGNLKYDAALLPCDEGELAVVKKMIGARPVWLAASTHPGEEAVVAGAHAALVKVYPELLTIIVPRHPKRGDEITTALRKSATVAQRSKKEPITPQTQIYVADTLGELGLFYRLCEIVFMGGSLVPHGGQNPLEPARLSCAIITGLHTHNFLDIYLEMERFGGCLWASDVKTLARQVHLLLSNPTMLEEMQTSLRSWVEKKGGAADRILNIVLPLFAPRKKAA